MAPPEFSSIATGFNGAKTNARITHNLSILQMNINCFANFFSSILAMFRYLLVSLVLSNLMYHTSFSVQSWGGKENGFGLALCCRGDTDNTKVKYLTD